MNKQTLVYPYNGILSDNKKEWSTDTCINIGESKNIILGKRRQMQKLQTEWFYLWDIPEKTKL